VNADFVSLEMPNRSSSKDPNVSAFSIMRQTTDGTTAPFSDVSSALDNAALRKQLMQEMGRRGGQKGGKARAESMTKARRKEIAEKAAKARWNKSL
jgi:general stress protein YciG